MGLMPSQTAQRTPVTIGETTRSRQLAAAGWMIVGSGIMCGTTLGGLPLYQNVLVLGGS